MDLPTTHYSDSPVEKNVEKKVENKTEAKPTSKNKLQKVSLYILLATIFLSPLIFLPSTYFPTDIAKVSILSIGILLSSILCIISSVLNRDFKFRKNPIIYSIILLVISVIISTLTSTNFMKSFIGQGFEITSASFVLLMFAVFFLVTHLTKDNKNTIFSIYIAILSSAIILVLFHLIRVLAGVGFMDFGILSFSTATFIGKWLDFAIFTGLLGLISFFGIKYLSPAKLLKGILYASLIVSGFILLAINFKLLWIVISIIMLGFMVYEYYTKIPNGTGLKGIWSRISLLSLIVLVIAVFGAWKNNNITANLSKSMKIEHIEVVLPWQLTLNITAETIKESPLLGAGPNRFGYQFLKFKPFQDINPSQFWSTEFTSGFGMIPTYIVSQGIIGGILWCLFFVFFIREGIKLLKRSSQDNSKKFFIVSSFFIALFLWFMNIVYIPSYVILFITFIFTGLFVSTLFMGESTIENQNPSSLVLKLKKLAPYTYIAMIILFVLWLGLYTKKIMAISYFQSGIKELNTSRDTNKAEVKFKKALSLSKLDVYYQALSEINILKLTALVNTLQNSGTLANPDKTSLDQISTYIKDAIDYTKKAQEIDPTNYYNYLAEARVSDMASSLKIPNSYENAKNAYNIAIKINRFNPALYVSMARLLATNGNFTEAQQYIGNALQLKQNYTEAVFLLSQIQVSNGQIKDAIVSSKFATQLNPNDQTLFLQLGLLLFNDKNYTEAVTALERAVEIDKQYANARYFLGLSYEKVGDRVKSIAQFEELLKTNPDSQEVAFILNNLKAGKAPFANVEPPIDNKPEKRKTLPVSEKSTSKKAVVEDKDE